MKMWPFGKKRTIADLGTDELTGERIKLEEEERRVLAKLKKAEEEKKRLFQQGTKETSQREKVILARKIKEVDEQAREWNTQANMISKRVRLLARLISVQRHKNELKKDGLWAEISKMSPDQLEQMFININVDDEKEREKMNRLMEVIEANPRTSMDLDEDADVLKIVEKMEQASESGEIEEKFSEISPILDAGERDHE